MTVATEISGLLEPSSKEHPDFVDVDRICTAEGLLIIISQRKDSGRLTFGIFRRYLREDKFRRTSFIPELLIDDLIAAITLAKQRMESLRKEGSSSLVMRVPPLG